jgi:hypothetical protein
MRMVAAVAVLSLAGCAGEPAARAPAPSTGHGATQTSGVSTIAAASRDQVPDTVKQALAAGYKPVVKDGNTLYCREEAVIGTRFPKQRCVSAEQLDDAVKQAQAAQDAWRRAHTCAGGGACGGPQ